MTFLLALPFSIIIVVFSTCYLSNHSLKEGLILLTLILSDGIAIIPTFLFVRQYVISVLNHFCISIKDHNESAKTSYLVNCIPYPLLWFMIGGIAIGIIGNLYIRKNFCTTTKEV